MPGPLLLVIQAYSVDSEVPVWIKGMLICYNSSVVILRLVFHSSFMQCYPLGSNYLVGSVFSV